MYGTRSNSGSRCGEIWSVLPFACLRILTLDSNRISWAQLFYSKCKTNGELQAPILIDGQQRLTTLQILVDALHAELLRIDASMPAGRLQYLCYREDSLNDQHYELQPIGWVESPLVARAAAPKQGDEGSPNAWLAFDARFRDGLRDLRVGDEVIVLTWLDRARRDVLVVHPRGDPANPLQGVFNTRSPDRPNPIGLHRVAILTFRGTRFDLEALDRTPIVDVKPVLDRRAER
jgi:tRNA-Thr(GGU) m(6)t(6)A37 methyltransferase TsaA